MDITLLELDAIAKTLPIGYYAKRRIDVEVKDGEETSYYIPTEDKVVISYEQIAQTLKSITDESYREMAIRSNLYHEISHAILTPKSLRIDDIINIFEDERIETLLRNYYMNVNFKKMVVLMNDYHGEAPTSAIQAFYCCVRFRNYKPCFVARVDDIIKKYAKLNRFTGQYNDGYGCWRDGNSVYNYRNDIIDLYNDIAKDFASSSTPSSGSDSCSGGMSGFSSDLKSGADKSPMSTTDSDGNPISIEDLISGLDDTVLGEFDTTVDVGEIVGNAFNGFVDNNLESALKIILDNFRKKNSKGSAINGYSGVINPRLCGREDYKFFEKAMNVNGTNHFGTLHLNLFIDRSGSFMYNEKTVNTLIKALSNIERNSKNFTLDLVFCGEGEKVITDKKDRFIKCDGGNYVDDKIFEIFRKLQKPNTYNYNIVLFDGDAFSDAPRWERASREVGKNFSAFDKSNVTMITDPSNKRYADKYIKTARVIYTHNYTDELIANVKQTLEKAFR